jgi:hypothetical protein
MVAKLDVRVHDSLTDRKVVSLHIRLLPGIERLIREFVDPVAAKGVSLFKFRGLKQIATCYKANFIL